ncbi:calcium-binding protein [Oleomonas cavernae]|uniref:Calcium-binding protein n=2 Tax=Oleomonas cavernae TaxID=2320859 RepID=A0A418W9D6_9PROT|nr:calcium-binding protein [Oleomonas cavernae]RJF86640.1 calcium-binding protein [Oleomonas cavernae]
MTGGAGSDLYKVDNLGDVADETGGDGLDVVETSATFALSAGIENLRMVGSGTLTGTGNALANDMLGNTVANRLYGLAGIDTLSGGGGDDTLDGGDDGDTLSGDSGNDTLLGGAGNDSLDGGTGDDDMRGGTGDDTYFIDSTADSISEAGGDGTDTVRSSVTFTLAGGFENLVITTSQAVNGTGNTLANSLTGGAGANLLYGLGGNDTLIGGAGTDTLDGGTGADTMQGGTGNDTYLVDHAGDAVDETGGSGTADTVQSTLGAFTLGSGLENLTLLGAGNSAGTGNSVANLITGNGGNNTLSGLGGNDTLDGGAGSDTMLGGAGNDTYIVETNADVADETGGSGTDIVLTSVGYNLNAGVENMTFTGNADLNGSGNNLANVITGNSGQNTIFAGDGNDTLTGGDGSDYLDGQAGADKMTGGTNNDVYVVDSVGDVVTELAGEGDDHVLSSITFTLGANFENLSLAGADAINGTGNDGVNSLNGNGAANILTGGLGSDTIDGRGGDDIIIGGEIGDYAIGGAGNDTFVFAPRSEGGSGADAIADFTNGEDVIDVSAFGFNDIGDILSIANDGNGNTLIDLGSNSIVALLGVAAATIDSSDFIFA